MAPAPTPRRSTYTAPLAVLGGMLVTFGLCLVFFSLGFIVAPPTTADAGDITTCLLFLAFIALPMLGSGAASLFFARRRQQQESDEAIQAAVLALAQQQNGVVTAADLALHRALPLLQAQDYLDQLAARGICRLEMTEEGETCFVFGRRRLADGEPEKRLDD